MEKKEKLEYVQWSYEFIKGAYLNKSEDVTWMDKLYTDYLQPFSLEFFGPKNMMLLFGGHEFCNLTDRTQLVARDGVIPLLKFFQELNPKDLDLTLYIPKDFCFLVPNEWRSKVKFYSVKSNIQYSSSNLPKKLFISGILNSTLADPDELEESLKHLVSVLGEKNIANMDIMAYFPNKRSDLWGSWDDENVLKFSALIFKYLKLDIKTPLWPKLHNESDFKDCLYYEINSGLFIKHSYLTNFTLSRGAGLLEDRPLEQGFTLTSEMKASLYHSYCFYDFDYATAEAFEDPMKFAHFPYFKRAIDFQKKGVKVNFQWEKWYASYIKKFYKIKAKQGADQFLIKSIAALSGQSDN